MKIYSSKKLICLFTQFFLLSSSILAQPKPQYDTAKGFYDYQKKMNSYFDSQKKENHDEEEGEEFEGEYEQWKRLEWYYSTRLGAGGKLVNMQQMKQDALQKASLLKNNIINQPEQVSGSWSQVGPTSVTSPDNEIGRVNCLAFLNSNANIIYAATAGGGLWKTTTGGTSWFSLTDGLPNINLSGVAVNQTNPNILYILTGDADGSRGKPHEYGVGKYSTGVLKTTDGGSTWSYTGLKWNETDNHLGYKLIMHPTNFNILMVAADDGVYRTTDGGTTWTQPLQNEKFYDIEFMPNDPLVVYAAAYGGRFFRSLNQGLTWSLIYANSIPEADRVSIAVTPANPSGIFMLIANHDIYTFNGLYYSPNMGESGTWVRRSSHLPNVFGDPDTLIDGQYYYDHSLAVNSFDHDKVVAAGVNIFRSTDGGITLNYVDAIIGYHQDVHELVYSPASNMLYAATDGGVYKSTNDGVTWTALNTNLTITQYYRISVTESNSSYILAGAQDNGTHLRNSPSTVFTKVVGADGMDNAISPSNPAVMYGSSQWGNFKRSNNSGGSFTTFCNYDTLAAQSIYAALIWVTNIQVSPTNHNIVFMGYNPVVKGFYNGTAWTFTNIGYQPVSPVVSGHTILKVAPGNHNIIYAGDNNYNGDNIQKFWRTLNGGTLWSGYTLPLSSETFTDMTMNPDDPDEIWLTYGGFSAGNKVFHSLDGGTNWTPYSGSLPNVPVNCIVYDDNNGNPNDALYIGTDIGVFYRDNSLGDWIPFSNGLPVVEVTDLEINETAGLLRAGTYGRGVWQTSLYDGACPASFTLTSHPPSEPRFISASNTITSTALITGAGAHVQYKAGQRITLNPGFRVDANSGAKHISYLGPCPGGGVPPGYYRSTFNGLSGYLIE